MPEIRVLNASLEDDDLTDQIIMRGTIDQRSLKYIHMAWYQREQGFSPKHTDAIVASIFANDHLADITIGMRGQNMRSEGSTSLLLDKCYCVDGGQRLYGAALAMRERPDLKIALGAKVYTNTTEEFENNLFCT